MFDFYGWLNSPLGATFQTPEMGERSYANAPKKGQVSYEDAPSANFGFGNVQMSPEGTTEYDSANNIANWTRGIDVLGTLIAGGIGLGGGTAGGTAGTAGTTSAGISGGDILSGLWDTFGGDIMNPKDTSAPMPNSSPSQYIQQVAFENAPSTAADVAQAKTGVIPEPVVGTGQITGKSYSFAEYAPEQVTKIPGTEKYFDNKQSAYGSNVSFANAPSGMPKGAMKDTAKLIMDGVLSNLEEKNKEMSSALKTMKNFKEDPNGVSANDVKEAIDSIAHGLEGSPASPSTLGEGHRFASKEQVFPNMNNPFAESYANVPKGDVAMENAPSAYGAERHYDLVETVNQVTNDVKTKGLDNWASNLGALAIEGIKTYVDLSLAAGGHTPYFQTAEQKQKDRKNDIMKATVGNSSDSPYQFIARGDEIIPVNKFTGVPGKPIAVEMSDEAAYKLVQKEIADATGKNKTELGKRLMKTSYGPAYKTLRVEELKNPKLTPAEFVDGGYFGGPGNDKLTVTVMDTKVNKPAKVTYEKYISDTNRFQRI